ncbi:hypothetical protein APZ41_018385, partial [Roseomonas mucosa]
MRAVEMTDHRHGVGEIVPSLLAQLPKAERIRVISGDGAGIVTLASSGWNELVRRSWRHAVRAH